LCIVTTDIGAEYDNARPLDDARKRTLSVNVVLLLDQLETSLAFVSELASTGCITWPQREHLIHTIQPRDKNVKLLEFLTRRSVADFEKFKEVLLKEQRHLVPLLDTEGGETILIAIQLPIAFIISLTHVVTSPAGAVAKYYGECVCYVCLFFSFRLQLSPTKSELI